MTREEAIEKVRQMSLPKETMEILETLAPELKESEDERIRKKLIWQVQMNIEDETADLQKSVYNGVKGHSPDLEESIKDWQKTLAWLEKQKEPIPIPDKFSGLKSLMLQYLQSAANRKDDSEIEDDTDLWGRKILDYVWKQDEKQKEQKPVDLSEMMVHKEPYIASIPTPMVADEQKPAEWSECKIPKDIEKDAVQFCFDKGINITPHQAKQIATHYLMVGHNEGYVEGRKNAHIPAKELGLPSSMDYKQEWSAEDEKMRDMIVAIFEVNHPNGFFKANEIDTTDMRGVHTEEIISWLKSLRPQPHWKPSEEQMEALESAMKLYKDTHFEIHHKKIVSLYEQLKKLI